MTVQAVEEVLRRAESDAAFADLLRHHPDQALHGYDIEYNERQALISGDSVKLSQLGINPDLGRLADEFNPTRQDPSQ